jgi:hypothetical protein
MAGTINSNAADTLKTAQKPLDLPQMGQLPFDAHNSRRNRVLLNLKLYNMTEVTTWP